ncbi:YwdI family protein [Pontibacillus litoralis]|uniref:YwdI family protein n=1 Tax=Pontibacillus litoralis JSM 072002 TaxID=1385512 RepID=A0A0A5G5U4_9BACI|nr:YwdI family protein [Pontibacillus litoralis]KGX86498.1 hypothetical protein N784_04905 [Pontibacillus litoralis JSM 072002]
MSVSYEQILKKMVGEIQEAIKHTENGQRVKEHVRAVQLLGGLILDDETMNTKAAPSIQAVEQMMHVSSMVQQPSTPQVILPSTSKQTPTIDHEEANGDSLLDF